MRKEEIEKYNELRLLVCELIEGSISEEKMCRLNQILANDPAAVAHYVDYLDVVSVINSHFSNTVSDLDSTVISDDKQLYLEDFWTTLAKSEEYAPAIEMEREPKEIDKVSKDIKLPEKRYHKLNIFGLAACAAVFMFFVFLSYFRPERISYVNVASLTGSVNAEWNKESKTFNSERLHTNKVYSLAEGLVQIQTDNGVRLTVEGPSVFELRLEGNMYLHRGKVSALVSPKGAGFVISTNNAKFIDLGTEFGVYVDDNKSSEIHVFKGLVQCYSGLKGLPKQSKTVKEHESRRFDAESGQAQVIPFKANDFARYVDSETGVVWRGQTCIDIANLIAGGNGFGNKYSTNGLNPLTGKFNLEFANKRMDSNLKYNLVGNSIFIDGVFIPDGGPGKTIVSSEGHKFQCPDTGGANTHAISTFDKPLVGKKGKIELPTFGGSSITEPVVLLHSNCGITLDLDAVRKVVPEGIIKSISSGCGVTENILDNFDVHKGEVDFWVLVDSQSRFEKRKVQVEDGLLSFDIDISERDRFLTFIVTDAASESKSNGNPWGNDYFYLVKPQFNIDAN